MLKPIIIILGAWVSVQAVLALQPIDVGHATLLEKNEKDNPRPAAGDIDEADPYFLLTGEADEAIKNKDYPTAVLRLRDALQVDPDNASNALLLSNLGLVYNYLDQDSLAMDAYDKALELAPSMTVVRANRGILNLKMGHDAAAWQDFGDVIARDSLNADARYYHGMISLYGGKLRDAQTDFEVLESVAPESYNTNVAMSSLYSFTGRAREAIPYYKKLIEQEPAPEYYAALAGCYLSLDYLPEASALLAEAFEKCGEDPELYFYRAWLNKKNFQNDAAKADAARAIDLGANPRKVSQMMERER